VNIALRFLAALLAAAPCFNEAAPLADENAAIAEARKYVKGRCTDTPCHFKARREGKQWNVWVDFTKPTGRGKKPETYHGGHVILYFDAEGRLVRRIQGQ
jgi:hypothetical protein